MTNFEDLVVEAIRVCLTSLLGPIAAKAVNFYLDPHLAAKDPESYVTHLKSMSGKASSVVLKRIEDSICAKAGLDKREWANLSECLAAARTKVAAEEMVQQN